MSLEDITTDWQCNEETYHIDMPISDDAFIVQPKWDCLNNVTITSAINSTLILTFNSTDKGVLLSGLFNVIGTAIDLVLRDEGLRTIFLGDISFVNFNRITLEDASANVAIGNLKALNVNGQPVALDITANNTALAGQIAIDGGSRIFTNNLHTNHLELCSVSHIDWHLLPHLTDEFVLIYGKIESLSANFTAQGRLMISSLRTKQLDIVSTQLAIKNLEALNGTINADHLGMLKNSILKVATDGTEGSQLSFNIVGNFISFANSTLIGGIVNIKAGNNYDNKGTVDVSAFNLAIGKNIQNDGDIIIRDQDGQFKAGGEFGNRGTIQTQAGKLAVIYNPEKEFYMGYLLGHSGVNISPSSNSLTSLPYYSNFNFVISSLSTHYIGDDIYHLLKGGFNLDGKQDYLHILNNKYVQFWLTKANGEFEVVSEYLSKLNEANARTVFYFLQKGAVAGQTERAVASTPYAWPGRGVLQDINGDGYLDYVEAIAWQDGRLDLGVYLGDRYGNIADYAAFKLPNFLFKDYGNAIYKVGFLKDLNGDGIVDYTQAESENLDIYLGTGGGFVKAGKLPTHAFWIYHSGVLEEGILQDINGDGIADFSKATCWEGGGCEQGVYLGNKDGVFTIQPVFALPNKLFWVGHGGAHVEGILRDLNGDGIPDFTTAAHWVWGDKNNIIYLGTGSGYKAVGHIPRGEFVFFISPSYDPKRSNWQIEGLLADFNGDGILDFSKASSWHDGGSRYDCQVHLGKAEGGFAEEASFELPTYLLQPGGNMRGYRTGIVLDINGDGKADIVKVITAGDHKKLEIYFSTGSGFVKPEAPDATKVEENVSLAMWLRRIASRYLPVLVESSQGDVVFSAPQWDNLINYIFNASGWLNITSGGALTNHGNLQGYNLSLVALGDLTQYGEVKFNNTALLQAANIDLLKGYVGNKGLYWVNGILQGSDGQFIMQAPNIKVGAYVESVAPVLFITDNLYFPENPRLALRTHNNFSVQGLTSDNAKVLEIFSSTVEVKKDANLQVDKLVVERRLAKVWKDPVTAKGNGHHPDCLQEGWNIFGQPGRVLTQEQVGLFHEWIFEGILECIEEEIKTNQATFDIGGHVQFAGDKIQNSYGTIAVGGNLSFQHKAIIYSEASLLEKAIKFSGRIFHAKTLCNCGPQNPIPAVFYVLGKITGQFQDINNVIIQGGKPEGFNMPNVAAGIGQIGEASDGLVHGNLNHINSVLAQQDVAGITGLNPNRPVTAAQQHADIAGQLALSAFSRDFYQINQGLTAGLPYYTYYIQEKYPSLATCHYEMVDLLKKMGIASEQVPPLFCTPNMQASLVSQVLQKMTGIASFITPDNKLWQFWQSLSDGKNSLSFLQTIPTNVEPECLQLEMLLKNCATHAPKYGYKFPNPLAEDKIDGIQEAFACPVIKTINGQEVVSLEVYLPKEVIKNSFAWHGAFLGAGSWEIELSGHFLNSGTLFTADGGQIITKIMANFGQMLLAGGALDITVKEKAFIVSLVELVQVGGYASSTQKSFASMQSISNGEYYIHGEASMLVQGANLKGKIVVEVDGMFYIVPAKLYHAIVTHNYQHASLLNKLSDIDGQIKAVAELVYAEGVNIAPGSSVEFIGKKGVLITAAFDQAEEWGHHCHKSGSWYNRKTTCRTWHNFISTPVGLNFGTADAPLEKFIAYSEDGDVTLVGAKLHIKEFNATAGTIDNPKQVRLEPAVAHKLEEVLTITKRYGLHAYKGNLNYVKHTREFHSNWREDLVPTVIMIYGDAYLYSAGQYVQLSSELHAPTGKITISSPTGYRIAALDSKEIHYVKMDKWSIGFGVVATRHELALKQSITISSEKHSTVEYKPLYSKITADQLRFEGRGVLETEGAIFQYNEAVFEVARHIDCAAFRKIAEDNSLTEAELAIKIGFRNNLGKAWDASRNLANQKTDTTVGKINAGFAAIAAYVAWVKAIKLPIQGGIWLDVSYSQSKMHIHKATPMPSIFVGGTLNHTAEYIELSGTQVKGERWFVSAREVLLTSAFGTFEAKAESYGGSISYEFMSGSLGANAFYNYQDASGQQALYAQIELDGELVMNVTGKLALEGAKVNAGSLKLNVGQLLLKSLHNLSKNKSIGGSISADLLAEVTEMLKGIGFNFGNGERKWVDDITMLLGREHAEIIVAGALEIMGSVVANAEADENGQLTDKGKLYLKAAELFVQDLYGYDEGILLGASLNLAYPDKDTPEGQQAKESGFGNEYTAQFGYKDFEEQVFATIGQGVVEIGQEPEQNESWLSKVNRNIQKLFQKDGFEIEPINAYWAESLGNKNVLQQMLELPKDILTTDPQQFLRQMELKILGEGKKLFEELEKLQKQLQELLGSKEAVESYAVKKWLAERIKIVEQRLGYHDIEKMAVQYSPELFLIEVAQDLGEDAKQAHDNAKKGFEAGGFVHDGYMAFSFVTNDPMKPMYAKFKIVGDAGKDEQPEGSVRCGDYYVKFDAAQFAVLLAYEGVLLRFAGASWGEFGERAKELLEKADVRVGEKYFATKPASPHKPTSDTEPHANDNDDYNEEDYPFGGSSKAPADEEHVGMDPLWQEAFGYYNPEVHGVPESTTNQEPVTTLQETGLLEGKLKPIAETADYYLNTYQDFEDSWPILAQASLTSGTILAKGVAAAIIAAGATAGTGAVLGFIAGLTKGGIDELKGLAFSLATGDALGKIIGAGIKEYSPLLLQLDSTLSPQEAAILASILAASMLSASEFKSFAKSLKGVDFGEIKIKDGKLDGTFFYKKDIPDTVNKVGSNYPRNADKAGKTYLPDDLPDNIKTTYPDIKVKYPNGVKYDPQGFPDFSPYAIKMVKLEKFVNYDTDFRSANKLAGLAAEPKGYTWHHHQDRVTMQLVPKDLHNAFQHTGGMSTTKHGVHIE